MSQLTIEQALKWFNSLDADLRDFVSIDLGIFVPNANTDEILEIAGETKFLDYVQGKAGTGEFPPIVGFSLNGNSPKETIPDAPEVGIRKDYIPKEKSVRVVNTTKGMDRDLVNQLVTLVKTHGFEKVLKSYWIVVEGVSRKNPKRVPLTIKLLAHFLSPFGKPVEIKEDSETD